MEIGSHYYRDSMELHEFFMQVPIPLVIMSGPEHLFTLTNKAYDKLIKRNVIGQTVLQAFTEEEVSFFIPLLDSVYNTGVAYIGYELYFPMKNLDGIAQDHWVSLEYHPFYNNNGKISGVLGFINDVTEFVKARRSTEQNVVHFQQLAAQLEAESELKEVFVSSLSHDLRTPLTIAKLCASSLAKNLMDIPALNRLALRISSNMDRADRMIQDLLDVSFIKAGEKLPLKISPCCMNNIITMVVEELSSMHENRFKIESLNEVLGFWDAPSIQRVLENLLLNAIKYGKENAIVTIHLSTVDGQVFIQVHNEGLPLMPNELKTLFERFKRLDSAQMGEQKGWGLGLTLVKGIIEAHGGSVGVKSVEGEGTTFSLKIPMDSSEF